MDEVNNYLVVANDDYLKYAKSLIYSIAKNDPKYKMFLYVVNPELENFKLFRKKLKAYNVTYQVIEKELSKDRGEERNSPEGAYSANIRGKLLKELVEFKELDNLTYIDADSLVVKPIDRLCSPELDLTFFMRATDTCSSGLIALNITSDNKEKLIQALDYFQNKIEYEYGLTKWFSDQSSLKDTYHEFIKTDILKYEVLSKLYFDWTCSSESSIWMGKGKKREREKYINLQKEYENLF